MTRGPRLTWVSEGKDFRRLRVVSKAEKVVEIAMLAHGNLLRLMQCQFAAARC
jgi:hypothetical protein